MTTAHTLADVELLLIGAIPALFACRVLTDAPSDLETVLGTTPIVRVTRIGGPTGSPGFDQPTVDVDCFGLTRAAALQLAYSVQGVVMNQLPGYSNAYGSIAKTETVSGPSWRPWETAGTNGVRRFGATYRLVVHSHI